MSVVAGNSGGGVCGDHLFVFVVVIFGITPDQSQTVTSLRASLQGVPAERYRVLVVDNSLDKLACEHVLAPNVWHVVAGRNGGLAKAYNIALQKARVWGADVLVTLDQDSVVTTEYLRQLLCHAENIAGNVVAMCPGIRSAGRIVSPFGFSVFGWPRYGDAAPPLYAINSFSAYSVDYLCSVDGFDEYYWLDALDFSVFARIAEQGLQVHRLDVVVDHDLSLLSGKVSLARMINMAFFEACFLMEYAKASHLIGGWIRLVARALRVRRYGLGLGAGVAMLSAAGRGAWIGVKRRGHTSNQ